MILVIEFYRIFKFKIISVRKFEDKYSPNRNHCAREEPRLHCRQTTSGRSKGRRHAFSGLEGGLMAGVCAAIL